MHVEKKNLENGSKSTKFDDFSKSKSTCLRWRTILTDNKKKILYSRKFELKAHVLSAVLTKQYLKTIIFSRRQKSEKTN
nr:hypothetical protein [Mycoplasmopsis bovis]